MPDSGYNGEDRYVQSSLTARTIREAAEVIITIESEVDPLFVGSFSIGSTANIIGEQADAFIAADSSSGVGVKSGLGVVRNNVRTYLNTDGGDAGFTFEAWVYPRARRAQ